jgi:hypothetical protein
MSKNKLCFLIIAAFVPLVLSAQIQVRLHQPPPNQLKIEHLWWVDLDNTTQLSYTVYLYAEIIEAQKGLIFKARSNSFKLTLGKKRITPKDITDVSNVWYASKYRDYIIRTGSVPEGTYTVCIYVMQEHTGSELGKHCITLPVYLAGAPRLISPQGGSKLKQKHPHFSWTTPAPQPPNVQVRYKIRVVEVLKGQTKEEAMGANVPWFEKGGLTTMSLGYPASARPLEKTKEYAWQIQAIDASGFPVGKNQGRSEIWQFEYAHREHPVVSAIPKLTVSRTAKREGNYYKVTLTIENSHSVNIRDLQIEDRSKGFQCINKFHSGLGTSGPLGPAQACSVITNFNGKSSCLICQQSTLGGNRTIRIRYFVVPVLYSSAGVPRIIGDSLVISYRVGDSYYSDYFENLPGCTPPTPDPAFANADYLIVTHPSKLFINNSPNRNDVNKLLSLTAELAKEKGGVLGYLQFSYPTASELRGLIRPGGSWHEELTGGGSSNFNYLLLIGQTEIVPSFNVTWNNGIIPLSDYKYADISGDEQPELAVGRILGRTAEELTIPIQSSIDVSKGEASYDNSRALLVSAAEGAEECFVHYVRELGKFLSSKISDVFKIYGEMYITRVSMLREGIWFDCNRDEYKLAKCILREWLWKGNTVEGLDNIDDIDDLSSDDAIEKAIVIADTVIPEDEKRNNRVDSLKLAIEKIRVPELNLNLARREDYEQNLATWLLKERNIDIPSTGLVTTALEEAKPLQYEHRGFNLPVYSYYDTPSDAGRARNAYVKRMAHNRDIIAYRGHGGEGSWCWVLDDWTTGPCPVEPIDFGNTRPVVLGFTCLSGYYEQYDSINGYMSIARAFLRNNAAIYIGATRSTNGPENQELVRNFLDLWEPSTEVGDTFVRLKQYALTNNYRFQVYTYNLYGDPKFRSRR